jgi:iron complex outermembrane receptor protein
VPETWNHELRLVSDQSNAFAWQAGAFYFKETNLVYTSRINQPYAYASGPPAFGNFSWLIFDYPDLSAVSKAVYGHGSFKFNDQFKLSAGVRYTKDTKFRHGFIHIFGGTIPVPDGHMDNSQTTWHIGLDYKPNTDTLLYVKADKGYKAGGYTNTAQYGPENLTAYEVGYKATFARRLQLDAAAFFNDYKDQQVSALGANITAGTQVFNAGKSEIKGLELGLKAAIGTGTNLGVHATFQDGTYKDFNLTNGSGTCPTNALPNTTPACNIQLAGNQTIQSPKISASVNLDQIIPLASGSTVTPSVTVRYNGKSYFSPFN